MDERRRYFRIEDTIGVQYEVLDDKQAIVRQDAIDRGDIGQNNNLQETERRLQLLIDKLRIQSPEVSEAIELLNNKFNLLKNDADPSNSNIKVVRASLSACGVSFNLAEQLRVGEKVYLDMILLPTDLHVHTVADVVGSQSESGVSKVSFEFNHLNTELEELLIQHIVKRQGRILSDQRQNNP